MSNLSIVFLGIYLIEIRDKKSPVVAREDALPPIQFLLQYRPSPSSIIFISSYLERAHFLLGL